MANPAPVNARTDIAVYPTYEPCWPDPSPMFLEGRVYQGSSGRVYPLAFTDRIAVRPEDRAWRTIVIENEFLRVTILPALGGRIHRIQEKISGHDLIYHQPVIKPALVGLTGPWISGGIEFNWPQHHRPSTFLPADPEIERHTDGSATVWLSEHDPMARMKGMHGVRLRPGRACVELVARVYNRTAEVQTFLWWANTAVSVHERYQSFFPPDVTCVADHARRAMSAFPLCRGHYYGVDYAARGRAGIPATETPRCHPPCHSTDAPGCDGIPYAPNDLSWYANIPVPTSYMAMGSKGDFMGGYDHRIKTGLVHVANHHISPGKKQWTWGNHEFGYAWDRNLTDPDPSGEYAPYIELMAGVYTDNQPDFSYLQPGETKCWNQYWYPIHDLGPAHAANERVAVKLSVRDGLACIGIAVTQPEIAAIARLERDGKTISEWRQTITPLRALRFRIEVDRHCRAEEFTLRVLSGDGTDLISYTPQVVAFDEVPPPATEPPEPALVASSDELFLIGLHLEQYRHATRCAEDYWREALRRDAGDARANLALGRLHLRREEFAAAETHLRAGIARLTSRNPNPADGESHYQLGLCLRHRAFASHLEPALLDEAYAAFYKATWSRAWLGPAHLALGEIDALRGRWEDSLAHLDRTLRADADNLRGRDLKVIVLRALHRNDEAEVTLRETLAQDPLDWCARHLRGESLVCDAQVKLDLAFDYARAGQWESALQVLEEPPPAPVEPGEGSVPPVHLPDASLGAGPMLAYTRAWLCHRLGDLRTERRHLRAAAKAPPEHCFPARIEECAVLRHAIAADAKDARAPFFLGHLLYDRRRYEEAIDCWERAVKLEPGNATAWRNLGIAYYNVRRQPRAARAAYERAFRARSDDPRLLYERDQLWRRIGVSPTARRKELLRHAALVDARDDLTIELCALHNQLGAPEKAEKLLENRMFQPWEGGEGQALGQHVRTCLALGRRALRRKNANGAIRYFRTALAGRNNLGEARHLLANQSDIHYWLGCALRAAGSKREAHASWTAAAESAGNFQDMGARPHSEMTYYSALALRCLGRKRDSRRLLASLLEYTRSLSQAPARIDYFATSLPTMLLFTDDLAERQRTTAQFLEAQARRALGAPRAIVRRLLGEILARDPNHALAADLASEIRPRSRRRSRRPAQSARDQRVAVSAPRSGRAGV